MNTIKKIRRTRRDVQLRVSTMAIAIAAIATMFASCSQDDNDVETRHGTSLQINVTAAGFSPSFGGGQGEVETRASDAGYVTTFVNGDEIGITVIKDGSQVLYDNLQYRYNGSSWQPVGDRAYKYNGSGTITFLAYYPYVATTMNGKTAEDAIITAFTPNTDQSTQAGYTASDLMTGTGSVSGTTLNVTLAHKMALLEITLPEQKYKATNSDLTASAQREIGSLSIGGNAVKPCLIDGVYRYIVKPNGSKTVAGTYEASGATLSFSKAVTPAEGKYHRLNVEHAGMETAVDAIDVDSSSESSGTNWTYGSNIFTVTGDAVIIGTTTANRVVVQSGATADITLCNVSIQASEPFVMQSSTVTLNLKGQNTIRSTSRAGIATYNGNLTITGGGSLDVFGQGSGAGIGGDGSYGTHGGTVTITGGTVRATGGNAGAGIGGGISGNGGTITISGGTVTATAGHANAAGIGGGCGNYYCSGGMVTISGGTVTIPSARSIGPGNGSAEGTITITGGTLKNSGALYPAPKNSGTTAVRMTGISTANVQHVTVNGVDWHISANHPGDNTLYLWLPHASGGTESYTIAVTAASGTSSYTVTFTGSGNNYTVN